MHKRLGILLALLLAAAACGGETAVLSGREVVSSIPWMAPETAHYRLLDGDDVKGTGELRIETQGDTLVFRQSFAFPDEKLTDDVSVVADAATLEPLSAERTIDGPEGARHCQAQYASGKVLVEQQSEKDQRADELDVPTHSYDSWSDLFLWRTLAFAADYEASYSDVLSCTLAKPQVISVVLKLKEKENVTVPAGTFQAWRLEIRSGGRTQKAWYADDLARTLVRYDNGDLVFELEGTE
ncbi:MAG: DUF3108 domain-containing protein [Chloroflexi bacterium]|nr:DUF3108 domain-containing protein [Chloroflexota bacterium]